MLRLSFLILVFIPALTFCQKINRMVFDEKLEKEVLCGYCNKDGLLSGGFREHYMNYFEAYSPDSLVIGRLKNLLPGISITVILGTWCSDSQEQVPAFYKIIDRAGYDTALLTQICVNRSKEACGVSVENLSITLVPTFVFYRGGKECGRITETPETTLENDMLKILTTPE